MTELQFNKTRFVRIMGFQAFHALSEATRAKRPTKKLSKEHRGLRC